MNMSKVVVDKLKNELLEHQDAMRALESARLHLSLADSNVDVRILVEVIDHQKKEIGMKSRMLEIAEKDAARIDSLRNVG